MMTPRELRVHAYWRRAKWLVRTCANRCDSRLANALLSVPVTLLILAAVPGNTTKLTLLVIAWAWLFMPLSATEWTLFLGGNLLFSVMDVLAVNQEVFRFTSPTIWGLPAYEFVMWGYYLVQASRVLGGAVPPLCASAGIFALSYAVAFSAIHDSWLLTRVTAFLLALGLLRFHGRRDLFYLGYMIGLGVLVEYVGVISGQWVYPQPPAGGVPVWFATLWGGVGLMLRRVFLPVVDQVCPANTEA